MKSNNPYLLAKIVRATPSPDCKVQLEFDDGWKGEVDLQPLIDHDERFASLADATRFGSFRVEFGALVWSDDLDLSPGSLRVWCEAGRFLNHEATESWIREHRVEAQEVA